MFVSPDLTDPRKYPRPEKFYSYFVLNFFFFLRLFRPKNIVFDVPFHSTESDATSLDSDSSQPIICLVLLEPPETTILLADIFSSAASTWNPFLTFVFGQQDKMIDFSAAKALKWQMHLSPFELFEICRNKVPIHPGDLKTTSKFSFDTSVARSVSFHKQGVTKPETNLFFPRKTFKE